MAREIGISKIHFFPLATDTGAAPTYNTPIPIKWAVSLETENQYSEGQYFADNIIEKAIKQISSVEVTLEVSSDLPPATEAKLTGAGYENGRKFTRVGQGTPAGALAYEISLDDGTKRKRVIYNVSLIKNKSKNATQEDKIEGETFEFEGIGIPLVSTGDVELTMDEKEIKAMASNTEVLKQFNEFFTKVVLPTGTATTGGAVAQNK
ncbi:MAG: major tail protein [Mycoplasmoidaceae bacterium]